MIEKSGRKVKGQEREIRKEREKKLGELKRKVGFMEKGLETNNSLLFIFLKQKPRQLYCTMYNVLSNCPIKCFWLYRN